MAMTMTFDWKTDFPPLSFKYDGQLLTGTTPGWIRKETTEATSGGRIRHCSITDPKTSLCVTAHVRTFDAFSAVDWVLEFENKGVQDTPIIEGILPLDGTWSATPEQNIRLHHAAGSLGRMDDFLSLTDEIRPGQKIVLASVGGRSSNGNLPFMNLQQAGKGVVLAIGWSGQWCAVFERSPETLHISAGMERTHLRLHPSEKIRTPRMLMIDWNGDDHIRGNNLLRRIILAHYTPRIKEEIVLPPVSHNTMSCFYFTNVVSEEGELEAIAHGAGLGVEAYWLDACWYGSGTGWAQEVGNWDVNRNRFPRGLKPLGDAAHKAGMTFVLWFEPQRVQEGTIIDREHPQYLLRKGGCMLFNLGLPEARNYMTDLLSKAISEFGVDVYRQDHNFDPLPYWQAADAHDRVGMTEIRHIEGLYAMWDELRRRHPGLAIDNCASGGRQIDLETTTRSFPLWRSDFSDVGGLKYGRGLQIGDQSQTAGLSRWVPLHTAAVYTFNPYDFRSAMSAGVALYSDIRKADFPTEDAKRAIAELKRLRPFFLGDFYPLLPLTIAAHDWCAYQFDRPDINAGFALFLRRHESPFPTMEVELKGIAAKAVYLVGTTTTFDEPLRKRMTGSQLEKMIITISEKPGSLLLLYAKA